MANRARRPTRHQLADLRRFVFRKVWGGREWAKRVYDAFLGHPQEIENIREEAYQKVRPLILHPVPESLLSGVCRDPDEARVFGAIEKRYRRRHRACH